MTDLAKLTNEELIIETERTSYLYSEENDSLEPLKACRNELLRRLNAAPRRRPTMKLDDVIKKFDEFKRITSEPMAERAFDICKRYLEDHRAEIEAGMRPVLRFRLRQYHETMLGETCWTADLLDTEGDPVFWWRSMGSSTRQGAIDSTNTMVEMVGLTCTFTEAPRDE